MFFPMTNLEKEIKKILKDNNFNESLNKFHEMMKVITDFEGDYAKIKKAMDLIKELEKYGITPKKDYVTNPYGRYPGLMGYSRV